MAAIATGFRFGALSLVPLTLDAASEWIRDRASEDEPCMVVTSNISHLRLAEIDGRFRTLVHESELNVADGWPLVLASRLLGNPVPGRIAGIDLVDRVLASQTPLRIAILGGAPGAGDELARRFRDRHEIVLVDPLVRGKWEEDNAMASLMEAVANARPNLVLIGIGPPRQEILAEALRSVVSGPIICCGCTIEVLAGLRPRAPLWMQKAGLEWAFRLGLEPRRLASRYLTGGVCFVRVLAREMRSDRRATHAVPHGDGGRVREL